MGRIRPEDQERITFLEEVSAREDSGLGSDYILDDPPPRSRWRRFAVDRRRSATKLDSGDKRFAELREDIKGARGELHDMRGDVSRILGILEKRKD